MYSIHFLNILVHYTCATCAHQWGKHSGATHRGQFCRWKASISPRFASAINCRSRWGWKNPLNSCTSCNSCKIRKSSNPVARSLQPPDERTFSTMSSMKDKLQNRLSTHLPMVVGMKCQQFYTLENFPYDTAFDDWKKTNCKEDTNGAQ
jgi:hypothetical protein